MKRLWLVLLSLGLVLAFSASAMAVDVKFSGNFQIGGIYLDKTKLVKDTSADGPSTAFYFQRLRLRTDFVISPGLSIVTRADIMSRIWGGARSTNTQNEPLLGSNIVTRPTSTFESENIAFDWAYISYVSPIGLFEVGYMNDNAWGTVFCDSATPAPAIQYILPLGKFVFIAKVSKGDDNSVSRSSSYQYADYDQDQYVLAAIYNFKDGSAGLLGKYIRLADVYPMVGPNLGRPQGILMKAYVLAPYAKFKIGPVTVQTELDYIWGKVETEGPWLVGMTDTKIDAIAGWVDVVADFNMFYVGGTVAYVSGDDPGTTDKKEGIFVNGGNDWNPCLIMWNYDRVYWGGDLYGYNFAGQNGPMGGSSQSTNNPGAWFFQGRAGVRPVPALDIMASVSYANADKKPTSTWLYNSYGWEVDVTGTYKITNNLSYMLGVGYLFTGDYYKGEPLASGLQNSVQNDYILINKLTLTF